MKDDLKGLRSRIPQLGRVDWIGIRPGKRAQVEARGAVRVTAEGGLEEDHYSRKGGKRQVTLIQAEHLSTIGKLLGQGPVDPALTRRNLVVSGINLLALKGRAIRIGEEVELQITGDCHPCSRMEENLGDGGYSAMRGLGGLTAQVVRGGLLREGDAVSVC
ncbi:MOSC domain-containing protein [Phaeodactylibacter luteus]|uniref:MOSC domain-containing protein n=1 Tax=Phaeodactylibacter luteus TaxID=1564516 RepID=A0A5C6RL21_9BACT|nr:MOSC domain-containing protein [Phaeodactylibacter luteus]TXB62645.1 MOSC domain-containing protein [Phaeodactylibacter luteus]